MPASRDGYFINAQNGGWISPTSGSQGMSQRVGRGPTTKIGYIGQDSRLLLQRGNLEVRNPAKCGSGGRSREQEMDRPPPQMLQYLEAHRNPVPCCR